MSTTSLFENYHSYMRGWYAGAGRRPMDPRYDNHPTLGELYQKGYQDGQAASRKVGTAYAKKIGYTPSILRVEGTPAADHQQIRLPIGNEDREHYTPVSGSRRDGRGRE